MVLREDNSPLGQHRGLALQPATPLVPPMPPSRSGKSGGKDYAVTLEFFKELDPAAEVRLHSATCSARPARLSAACPPARPKTNACNLGSSLSGTAAGGTRFAGLAARVALAHNSGCAVLSSSEFSAARVQAPRIATPRDCSPRVMFWPRPTICRRASTA